MTTLREAAQQALEALEHTSWRTHKGDRAIIALRAALAQEQAEPRHPPIISDRFSIDPTTGNLGIGTPELAEPVQGPVYWEVRRTAHPKWMRVDEQQFDEYVAHGWEGRRLYTPLTDEDIEQEYKKGYADGYAAGYDNGDSEGFTRGTDSMVPASLAAWRAETKPLTEAQIYAAIKGIDSLKAVEVARAIERAHGIKENAND